MTLFYSIGFHSHNRHLIRRFTEMHLIETFCGKILSGAIFNNIKGTDCKLCEKKFAELLDSIDEFHCNLCSFTTKVHFRRIEHFVAKHPNLVKTDSEKAESKKWYTIIFKKKYHGHELVIKQDTNLGGWIGSCICTQGKFHSVQDKKLCFTQFSNHIRESEVLPIAF